jgi:PAS domain S-box-containing protein
MSRLSHFLLDVPPGSPDDERRRRLLATLLAGTAAFALAELIVVLLYGPIETAGGGTGVGLVAVILAAMAGLFILNRFWRGAFAGWFTRLVFLALMTAAYIYADTPEQVAAGREILPFTLNIVLGSVLLDSRAAFLMAAVNSVAIGAVALSVGLEPSLSAMMIYFLLALIAWLAARNLETASRELREGEARYRALVENVGEGMGIVDETEAFLFANSAAHMIFGLPPGKLVGRNLLDFTDKSNTDIVQRETASRRDRQPGMYDLEIVRPGGERRYLLVTTTPRQGPDGKYLGAFGIFRDITERTHMESALQESRTRYRELVEAIYDWIWETNAEGVYTYVSPQVRDILGYEPEEMLGKHPTDFIDTPEEAQWVEGMFRQLWEMGKPLISFENTCRGKDGRQVVMETSGKPFFDSDGRVAGYRGVDRDITARRHAEQARRASEDKFSRAFHMNPDAIYISRLRDNACVEVNEGFTSLTGYKPSETLGKSTLDLGIWVRGEDRDRLLREIRDRGELRNMESQFRTKSGAVRVGLVSGGVIELGGEPCLFTITRDITERQQAEENLRRAYTESENLLTAISSILIGLDESNRVIQWNAIAEEVFGLPASQMLGQPLGTRSLGWDWLQVQTAIAACRQDAGRVRLEAVPFKRADGRAGSLG